MHWNSLRYCQIRHDIEQRGWILTTKLHGACERLMDLIGVNYQAFGATKRECGELRAQLIDCREELRNHRDDHHC